MPETHLSHDEFFNKLGDLFTARKGKDHGSIFLSQKRGMTAPLTFAVQRTILLPVDIAPAVPPAAEQVHLQVSTGSIMAHGSSAPVPTAGDPLADLKDPEDGASFPVIVRATNGKSGDDRKAGRRVKLATVVQSGDLDAFYARYAEICKAGMLALKPRVRTKRKAKSKKKKTTA
ncbi:hypothetical protein SLS64_010865 [Diaporthe eres]